MSRMEMPVNNISTSAKLEESQFNLFDLSSIKNDSYLMDLDTMESLNYGAYSLSNYYPDDCGKGAREIQTGQKAIHFRDGYGYSGKDGCGIEADTEVRFQTLTDMNYINQLFPRVTKSTPYVRGFYNVNDENVLINSTDTLKKRACNTLSGISTLELQYTPMVPKLQKEVQNTNHIIPENSKRDWVRGGLDTRSLMRNYDYSRKCNRGTYHNNLSTGIAKSPMNYPNNPVQVMNQDPSAKPVQTPAPTPSAPTQACSANAYLKK
jgi:hypothetical protein